MEEVSSSPNFTILFSTQFSENKSIDTQGRDAEELTKILFIL